MRLTKNKLNNILENMRVSIPVDMKTKLLAQYGNLVVDVEGHVFEYTEQDIWEQLRKILRPYEYANKEVKNS